MLPKYIILGYYSYPNGDEMVHLGTSWYKMVIKWFRVVHRGANLLKEKHWQICGKFMALTLFF